MAKHFGSDYFPLKCLKCGHQFKERIARLETNPTIPCPSCGTLTKYDAKGLREGTRKADRAIDDLKKAFKKFGKS